MRATLSEPRMWRSAPFRLIDEMSIRRFSTKKASEPPLKGRKIQLLQKLEQKRSIS